MGSSKPLLPWFGATLVERQVEALLRAGVDIVCVVTGYRGDEVAAAVGGSALFTDALLNGDRRVVMAHNPNFKDGKTTSIRAGLAALPPRLGAIAVLAVDQPRPASVTLRVLKSHAASGRPATSPRFDGHGGHPLIFDGALMPELEAVSEAKEGLREVMRRYAQQINWVPFDDPIVRLDLNTPDAYQAALKTFPDPRHSR